MKTIEERAEEYSKWQRDKLTSKEAYIAGALDQRHIDTCMMMKNQDDMTQVEYDRETEFIDWFTENNSGNITYSDAIEWARKDLLDKVCEWLGNYFVFEHEAMSAAGCDAFLRGLRKAMEK